MTKPRAVIAVPVYGQLELTTACLVSLNRTTPAEVGLLVVDDCGPERIRDEDVREAVARSGRSWQLIRNDENLGYVATANLALRVAGDDDVVLVNSDVQVFPGWWEAFRRAREERPDAASLTAFGDRASILSVPSAQDPDEAALARLAELRPSAVEIPVAVGHCTYFCRGAVDLVGDFDPAFSPGYGEEVDWSLRARRRGLRHVAATGAYVRHAEGASFGNGAQRRRLRRRHEVRLASRYPLQILAIRRAARDSGTPLALARRAVAEALGGAEQGDEHVDTRPDSQGSQT
jgi:GT2 family glycosyltransferase